MSKLRVFSYDTIFQEEKAGGYSVWVPELPGCASQGDSLDEAKKNIEEAINLYLEDASNEDLESLVESGRKFLIPVSINFPTLHG